MFFTHTVQLTAEDSSVQCLIGQPAGGKNCKFIEITQTFQLFAVIEKL